MARRSAHSTPRAALIGRRRAGRDVTRRADIMRGAGASATFSERLRPCDCHSSSDLPPVFDISSVTCPAMEAQRVISVSLGKIAQSRVQRSGCSLHKSLMVASILQKARHLYVEQAFMMHCRPQAPPAVTVTPPPPATPVYTDLDACSPAERGVSDAPTPAASADSETAEPARRKRLISDEETEEAVASILPKRARTEAESEAPAPAAAESPVPAPEEPSAPASESKLDSKDADSDDSDDSCYESGDSDDSEADAMEIDRITSLVSVFSFDSLKLRQQSGEACARTGEWELAAADPVSVTA